MLILLAAASFFLAQAAEAAPPPAPASPAAAAKPNKPKLICTRETGIASAIPKRVCRTPEQVEAELRASRLVSDRANSTSSTCQSARC